MKTAVIDYGAGNLRSVMKALKYIGADCDIISDADGMKNCNAMILPGVGAFATAVQKLKEKNLFDEIKNQTKSGKPLFGICLGMQLLLEKSYEFGETEGLGLISGTVERLNNKNSTLKVPHMGWNCLKKNVKTPLLDGINDGDYFYFVHSFAAVTESENVCAYSDYGDYFPAVICKNNVFGTQFHPEKSGEKGLLILKNFIEMTK